jgi:hypothetical protein
VGNQFGSPLRAVSANGVVRYMIKISPDVSLRACRINISLHEGVVMETRFEDLIEKMVAGNFKEIQLGDGYKLFSDDGDSLKIKNRLGEWPVQLSIAEEPIELAKDGYENGVNCINRVGQDDELIAGWFSEDAHVVEDNIGSWSYNRREEIMLSRGDWALTLEGYVGNGDSQEFFLYVGK